MRRLELVDTSIVVELLRVPGKSGRHAETVEAFEDRAASGIELQMPVAAVIQAGAHVGRLGDGYERRRCADLLAALITNTIEKAVPWSFTPLAWDRELLVQLINPPDDAPGLVDSLATEFLEIGDLIIVSEYRRIRRNLDTRVVDVDVWTYDANLRGVIDALRA